MEITCKCLFIESNARSLKQLLNYYGRCFDDFPKPQSFFQGFFAENWNLQECLFTPYKMTAVSPTLYKCYFFYTLKVIKKNWINIEKKNNINFLGALRYVMEIIS